MGCTQAGPTIFKTNTITIHADGPRGEIGPQIFGHFTEETLTSWEGGSSSRQKVFDPGNPRFPCSYDAWVLEDHGSPWPVARFKTE
jgi:hypothetical protein